MAKLKFVDDADGNPTKEAVGMYSKEGEYVDFDKPCDCSGQVKETRVNFFESCVLSFSNMGSSNGLKCHAPRYF